MLYELSVLSGDGTYEILVPSGSQLKYRSFDVEKASKMPLDKAIEHLARFKPWMRVMHSLSNGMVCYGDGFCISTDLHVIFGESVPLAAWELVNGVKAAMDADVLLSDFMPKPGMGVRGFEWKSYLNNVLVWLMLYHNSDSVVDPIALKNACTESLDKVIDDGGFAVVIRHLETGMAEAV